MPREPGTPSRATPGASASAARIAEAVRTKPACCVDGMGLVALLSTLAAARASPEPRTFDRLCTIRAATTGGHDSNGDYYGGFSTNSLVHHERRVCGAPSQYMSAVAIGSRAYLAPFRADHIGVVDVSSSTFSTISMPDDGVTSELSQYIGAAGRPVEGADKCSKWNVW